jgi:plastocyanin
MTTKSWLGVIGVGMLTLNIGCARDTPLSPSEVNDAVSGTEASALTTTSTPVVTLLPDLTVDPARVTVMAGSTVKMVNKSGRYAKVHSYNCSEFSGVNLPNGGWIDTWEFSPAGKTCDYFVWDVNRTRKIFAGQVAVQ